MRDRTDQGHGSVGGPAEGDAVVFVCAACGVPPTGDAAVRRVLADARGLEPEHAAHACCGAGPDGGMNQLCACGTLVATLSSDCAAPYELHLSAAHVRAVRP
ncbi:hypothetical protein [Streptomyces erythrochromogenes]|uniref:hypothetical protein n=1 Tax=Streptomyces erythrochromogenes TaxID=285574 RepID=UPI0037FA42E1